MRGLLLPSFALALAAAAIACSSSRRGNRRGDEPPPPEAVAMRDSAPGGSDTSRTSGPAPIAPAPPVLTGAVDDWHLPSRTRLPRHNDRSPLGTNLAPMRENTGEYAFVDLFKQSRAWISGRTAQAFGGATFEERGRKLNLDERGWVRSLEPGQVARTIIFGGDGKVRYPSGNYVILYDGEGTIDIDNAQKSDVRRGRMVVTADGTRGFLLTISATEPRNYIRNIRVLMPGGVCRNDPYTACNSDAQCGAPGACESFEHNYKTQILHPIFLNRLKKFGALRFEDWLETDGSTIKEWADRAKLDDARWSTKGVPIEIVTELANRLHAEAWVNVPHLAGDAYVRSMMEYLRENLDPDLKIYLEYSSEPWNQNFEQGRWFRQQAKENPGMGRDEMHGAMTFYSRRAREVFKLAESALGGRTRLVRVLAANAGNSFMAETVVDGAQKEVDALATQAVFGERLLQPDRAMRLKGRPIDQVIEEVAADLRTMPEMLAGPAEVAKKYELSLLAFEGGDVLVPMGPAMMDRELADLFDRLPREPRMKAIYLELLGIWKNAGGGMFFHFPNCIAKRLYRRSGALEYLEQPRSEAPKYDALMEFIDKHPR